MSSVFDPCFIRGGLCPGIRELPSIDESEPQGGTRHAKGVKFQSPGLPRCGAHPGDTRNIGKAL